MWSVNNFDLWTISLSKLFINMNIFGQWVQSHDPVPSPQGGHVFYRFWVMSYGCQQAVTVVTRLLKPVKVSLGIKFSMYRTLMTAGPWRPRLTLFCWCCNSRAGESSGRRPSLSSGLCHRLCQDLLLDLWWEMGKSSPNVPGRGPCIGPAGLSRKYCAISLVVPSASVHWFIYLFIYLFIYSFSISRLA